MEPVNPKETPRERAEDQMLDAVLRELGGAGPGSDLAMRISTQLRRTPRHRRRAWLAAAVLLAGMGVVAAVAVGPWGPRSAQRAAASGQEDGVRQTPAPEPEDPTRQDPTRQDPVKDPAEAPAKDKDAAARQEPNPLSAKEREQVHKRIGELSVPTTAPAARAALVALGVRAVPELAGALFVAREHLDAALVMELSTILAPHFPYGPAKLAMGWPVEKPITLIADYSDNRVVAVDAEGRVYLALEDTFGAWDAELTWDGRLLVTEFSVSRVSEFTPQDLAKRQPRPSWTFEGLKNPYCAQKLATGNYLIADAFGGRVIEVDRDGAVVWKYDRDIRPFDAERLADGNTLIADVKGDRLIEVTPEGKVVWEVLELPNVHDVDRLADGTTLVTLRSKNRVQVIDRDGKVLREIAGLSSPSDADMLANGHILVAENAMVREFDTAGKEVWKKEMTWAVEVNRY